MTLRYAHQDFFSFLFASETSTDILSFCIAGTCSSRRCSSRHTLLFIWTTPRTYSGQHGTEDTDWPLFTVLTLLLGLTRGRGLHLLIHHGVAIGMGRSIRGFLLASSGSSLDTSVRTVHNFSGVYGCGLVHQSGSWIRRHDRTMHHNVEGSPNCLSRFRSGHGRWMGDWQSFRGRVGGCAEVIQTGEMRRADVQAICAASYSPGGVEIHIHEVGSALQDQ